MSKKFIAFLTALLLCFTLSPATTWAADVNIDEAYYYAEADAVITEEAVIIVEEPVVVAVALRDSEDAIRLRLLQTVVGLYPYGGTVNVTGVRTEDSAALAALVQNVPANVTVNWGEVRAPYIAEWIEFFFRTIQPIVWGPATWGLLLLVGLILSFKTNFMQVSLFTRYVDETIVDMLRKNKKYGAIKGEGDITPWQAVNTAFSATMGVGTLAGTATAIALGGPGAVFWMWVVAFFGITTKFAEVTLAVHYRSKNAKGEILSGPFAYIEKGLGWKWLAIFFAAAGTIASFGIGNMVQANSAAGAVFHVFGWNRVLVGIVAATLIGAVVIGGLRRIAIVMERVIPFLALTAIISCIIIILMHIVNLPRALGYIIAGAFTGYGFVGGTVGYAVMWAIRMGLMRGIFSNEAGLGSAPMAYSAAKSEHPTKQGFWAAFEVFLDTHVMCTLVALAILTTIPLETIQPGFAPALTAAPLIIEAYYAAFGRFGSWLMAFLMATFGFTTVIGWTFYGEKCFEYLFGLKHIMVYRVAMLPVCVFGAAGGVATIWAIADTLNAFMVLPNIIAVVALSGVVTKLLNGYLNGEKYVSFADEEAAKSGE